MAARTAALESSPELVNLEPYGNGWMIKLGLSNARDVESLLTAEQYEAFTGPE
ncbi:glycine cleavage H-protein [Actinobacteria bacterium OV450]|nr:glycine cleavage H-protein [Actinobacteria bacterium OV450]